VFRGLASLTLARAAKRRFAADLSFLYSFQKGSKQGWPAASLDCVEGALLKHKLALCRPVEELDISMEEKIKDTAAQIFNLPFIPQKFLPTASAAAFVTRDEGGNFSAVVQGVSCGLLSGGAVNGWGGREEGVEGKEDDGKWTKLSQAEKDKYLSDQAIGSAPLMVARVNELRAAVFTKTVENCLDPTVREIMLQVHEGRESLRTDLRPVAICEAGGKVRVVTCGDSHLYSALQPLQGWLIDCWKKTAHSTMTSDSGDLTARVKDMYQQVEAAAARWDPTGDPLFVTSGDHSAATDKVKRRCTLAALEGARLTRRVPDAMMRLGKDSFGPGNIYYQQLCDRPTWVDMKATFENKMWDERCEDEVGEEVGGEDYGSLPYLLECRERFLARARSDPSFCLGLHQEGQPMGHPLSFPILCVTNLAVLRLAVDRWVQENPHQPGYAALGRAIVESAIVNGDDILFVSPLSLLNHFRWSAGLAGFEISVGKNYVSRVACMINSQLFKLELKANHLVSLENCGYLNQNLFDGSIKSASKEANRKELQDLEEGGAVTKVNEYSPLGMSKSINDVLTRYPRAKIFLPRYTKRLMELPGIKTYKRPNWFIPVHLGGLGIRPEFGKLYQGPYPGAHPRIRTTVSQRHLAAAMVNDRHFQLFTKNRLYLLALTSVKDPPPAELEGIPARQVKVQMFQDKKGKDSKKGYYHRKQIGLRRLITERWSHVAGLLKPLVARELTSHVKPSNNPGEDEWVEVTEDSAGQSMPLSWENISQQYLRWSGMSSTVEADITSYSLHFPPDKILRRLEPMSERRISDESHYSRVWQQGCTCPAPALVPVPIAPWFGPESMNSQNPNGVVKMPDGRYALRALSL